jgi:hypothetical protein
VVFTAVEKNLAAMSVPAARSRLYRRAAMIAGLEAEDAVPIVIAQSSIQKGGMYV